MNPIYPRSIRRILLATVLVVAGSMVPPAGASVVQTVTGTILHPAATGAVARNAWVASQGSVNGVSGYAFQVDPATIGHRFIVDLDIASGFDDTNITFYNDY